MRSELNAIRSIQAGRRGEDAHILLARAKLEALAQRKSGQKWARRVVFVAMLLSLANLLRVAVSL
jgi:hypothetical protein